MVTKNPKTHLNFPQFEKQKKSQWWKFAKQGLKKKILHWWEVQKLKKNDTFVFGHNLWIYTTFANFQKFPLVVSLAKFDGTKKLKQKSPCKRSKITSSSYLGMSTNSHQWIPPDQMLRRVFNTYTLAFITLLHCTHLQSCIALLNEVLVWKGEWIHNSLVDKDVF